MNKETLITNTWNKYFNLFSKDNIDIYFTEEYVKLYETVEDKAECFIYREKDSVFIFPYLKRRIKILGPNFYDFETPYGYGGPLSNNTDSMFIESAAAEFSKLAVKTGIVSGFIRFHPLFRNHILLGKNCDVLFDRKTVAIDLRQSEQDIWNIQVHKNHRTSIRKAESMGLEFVVDDKLEHLNEFIKIYNRVLTNIGSDDFYRFNTDYYENIKRLLSGYSFLGLVYLNDKIISAILFFLYDIYGHAHLGGSLAEYFSYCPNNFLFFKAALCLKAKGARYFHFGGGTDNSQENPLYKFKKRFSKTEFDFFIGKMVLNEDIYHNACAEWENKFPDKKDVYKNRVLKYRF